MNNIIGKYPRLSEAQKFNQHRLLHGPYPKMGKPSNRQNAIDLVNQLDTEMTAYSKKELENAKKGITKNDVLNPLKYVKKNKPNLPRESIKIVKGNIANGKYSIWLKHTIKTVDCYWQVCDRAGLTEWDDLSDIPNYLGIVNKLRKGIVDGGFLFNKYIESWDEANGR